MTHLKKISKLPGLRFWHGRTATRLFFKSNVRRRDLSVRDKADLPRSPRQYFRFLYGSRRWDSQFFIKTADGKTAGLVMYSKKNWINPRRQILAEDKRVARDNGSENAYYALPKLPSFWRHAPPDGLIQAPEVGIYMHPAFQRQGIGRQAIHLIMAELKQKGFSHCFFSVHRGNRPSRALFEKMGFEAVQSGEFRFFFTAL